MTQNISINSHNQIGGITAHTVNFGQSPRSLNEELGRQIKHNIPTTATVRIVAIMGDGEAFGFANQILAWMKGNGYAMVDGVDQAIYSKPVLGQNINMKGEGDFELIIGTRQ